MRENTRNLLPELLATGIDGQELWSYFSMYFGGISGSVPGEAAYVHWLKNNSNEKLREDYSLKVVAGKRGLITGVYPGQSFTDADLLEFKRSIQTNLVDDCGSVICAAILYSAPFDVKGQWRYRDLFQIQPLPANLPQQSSQFGENPFILEFKVKNSPKWDVRRNRRYRELKKLALVLNAFIEGHIIRPYEGLRLTWGRIGDDPKNEQVVSVKAGYRIKGFQEEKKEFSAMTNISELAMVPIGTYYSHWGRGDSDLSVRLPDNMESLLDSYCSLSDANRGKFLTACYWLNHAEENKVSRSAAYVAFVQSIEALLPKVKSRVCPSCSQPEYKLSRSFAEFLEKYAPSKTYGGIRKKLYAIRSELSHGKRLLASENWDAVTYQDDGAWFEIQEIVKVVFANWILDAGLRNN